MSTLDVESVHARVVGILAEQAAVDAAEVKEDSSLEELGIDSLGVVELVFAIEETFDIQVPFNANDPTASEFDVSSVATVVSAIEDLIRAKT